MAGRHQSGETEPHQRLLSYDDLERLYGLKRGTAASYVHQGKIPHIKLGPRNTRFDPKEIDAWIEARRVPARDRHSDDGKAE